MVHQAPGPDSHEGREFAFVTTHRGHDETKWTYRFQPERGGTTVTESFEMLADVPWYLRLVERALMGVKDRRADLEANMRETLRLLKAAAEGELSGSHTSAATSIADP